MTTSSETVSYAVPRPCPKSGNPFLLTGQTILITGAAGGIGSETAKLCARLGATVLATDRAGCADLVRAIGNEGGKAEGLDLDLAARGSVEALADWADMADTVIMAAGAYQIVSWDSPNWESAMDLAMDVNLRVPALLARAFVDRMVDRGGGRMVLVGSMAASTGGSFAGIGPHYAISKGGLHTLIRWLTTRYGSKNLLVNGVAPGTVFTAMNSDNPRLAEVVARQPMGRAAQPEEIAAPLAFLCSPAASFVSGAILDVNGANYLR
jgi:Dehydrogenases with different specificities (related to short-chain alcohol dehydrogenases)